MADPDPDSDWDSDEELPPPKPQPMVTKKPNDTLQHQQGDSRRVKTPHEEKQGDGQRATDPHPAAPPVPSSPPVPSRGTGRAKPKQRHQESHQSELRQKLTERQQQEEQPPFNFRPEADDGQRGASRQKPRPPGRQQRSEYTVPAGQAAGPAPGPAVAAGRRGRGLAAVNRDVIPSARQARADWLTARKGPPAVHTWEISAPAPAVADSDPEQIPAAVLRDPDLTPAVVLWDPDLTPAALQSPSPRPRSAQRLALLHTEDSTALRSAASQDSFWRGHRVTRDPVPFLGHPIPPILPPIPPILPPIPPTLGSDHGIPLHPLSSPGVVRHSSPALDHATSVVLEPPSSDGPLVPLDGPRSCSKESSPVEETETAALAVAVSSYQFSQPDLRVLRSRDQNPSQLLGRCGKPSHRQLMKMWSEVLWVVSVPIILITTFCLALTRCLLEVVVRPLTLGPLQLLGDHLLKPAAVTLHDALLLPAATLLANTLSVLALAGRPLGEMLNALVRPLATLLASCRLVQVSYGAQQQQQQRRADGPHQV